MWAPERSERDLNEEMLAYVESLAEEYEAAGVPPDEARRRARLSAGGIESVKESVRDARAGAGAEQVMSDIRYALRTLRRTPAFAVAVVLTLGLGIGVNTSVFTVLNAVLLAPLPYERPEELVDIGHRMRAGTPMEGTAIGIAPAERALWRAETALFQGAEVYRRGIPLAWRERDEDLSVGALTAGLPALLGIKPRIGRMFTAQEVEMRTPVLVISDALWARAFNRDANALGADLTLAGAKLTVIGVMPASFRYGPGGNGSVDAWVGFHDGRDPRGNTASVFRLRTGLTPATAQPLAEEVARRIQEAQPPSEPWTPVLYPIDASRSAVRENQGTAFMLLLLATAAVLLAACANIANLFTARNAGRRHELAVRAALGATRPRLVRMMLFEGTVVAALGGMFAVLLAQWTLDVVVGLMPARLSAGLFAVSPPTLDWRVLTYAALLTVMVAMLSALWPAVRGAAVTLRTALADGLAVAGASRERRHLSATLQMVQVVLALVLVTTAGLFGTSLVRMLTADRGFDPQGLVTLSIELPEPPYVTADAQYVAAAEALRLVRSVPGVQRAALGSSPPSTLSGRFVRSGSGGATASLAIRYADDEYFRTAGIPLRAGRWFGPDDTSTSMPVAIIDDAAATALFPGESPIGQRFSYSPYVPELTIIGVVGTVAASDFNTGGSRFGMYLARSQNVSRFHPFVIRTDRDEALVLASVRAALEAWEPGVKVSRAGLVAQQYEELDTFARPRFALTLVGFFATMALATAAVGVYGVLAYAVGLRRREIGVRLALGSSTASIRRLVIADAVKPVGCGLLIGLGLVWMTGRVVEAFLFNVGARDPLVLTGSIVVVIAATILAALAPLRHATGVNPIQALRAE